MPRQCEARDIRVNALGVDHFSIIAPSAGDDVRRERKVPDHRRLTEYAAFSLDRQARGTHYPYVF